MPEIIFIPIIIILTVLYLLEKSRADHLSSSTLLQSATQKSEEILSHAGEETIKIEKEINSEVHNQLQDLTTKAQDSFKEYLNQLQTKSQTESSQMMDYGKTRINQILDKFEGSLSEFLSQTSQRSVTSIELEIRAARQLVESYKHQQLTIIDENIIAMLEQTLSIVLSKKLSLKDQTDLVYEALEKAKIEKFII